MSVYIEILEMILACLSLSYLLCKYEVPINFVNFVLVAIIVWGFSGI